MDLQEVTPALLRRHPLPAPAGDDDKNRHGQVLIAAGSRDTPGAALLSAEAALRAGIGKVTMAVPRTALLAAGIAVPESRVVDAEGRISRALLASKTALLIGPGMAPDAAVRWRSAAFEASDALIVLDAAAMQRLRRPGKRMRPTILTPHAGEMAALSNQPESSISRDPVGAARAAAREFGMIVVLKGTTTVIAAPGGATFRHRAEIAGLGVSGSGDVLAGLIVGLAGQGVPAIEASLWGVALHAAAGRRLARRIGTTGYLARELAAEVPRVMQQARRK